MNPSAGSCNTWNRKSLLAGSLVRPGGLKYVSEMVQVETLAEFGVVFLSFALGLEFSMPKLKDVGPVAVLGGLLQILILMYLCGTVTMMVKFLVEKNSTIEHSSFRTVLLVYYLLCCQFSMAAAVFYRGWFQWEECKST